MSENTQLIRIYYGQSVGNSAEKRAKRKATNDFGGYTELDGEGGWRAPNGRFVTEDTTVLEIVADGSKNPRSWAKVTARHLQMHSDEDSVMWTISEITAGYE